MVGKLLINIRQQLGFPSARRFYNDHLNKKKRLEFNYQYYMKIEGDKVIASPKIISLIAATLPEEYSDQLTLAYCETIFPAKRLLFRKLKRAAGSTQAFSRVEKNPIEPVRQQYLTEAQIAVIGRSKEHYYCFLIVTIARGAIYIPELKRRIRVKEIKHILEDLIRAKLVTCENNYVVSISNEMRFPKDVSNSTKRIYENIDQWDRHVSDHLNFETPLQKMIVRRVSSRYIEIILNQANGLFDILKAADETNQTYNEEVMMISLTISQGKLPG